MFKISLISYLLLLFTFLYVETKLSGELREIYRFHKKVRKDVKNCKIPGQPPAVKLAKMKWNKLLADKAKQQVKRCQYDSNDPNDFIIGDFESIGQNLGDYPTTEGDSEERPYEAKSESECNKSE
uniref:SCP domain-containing protein n=1 Tax=Schistosoma haematobium TaxID=6185 RepID=A0A095AHC6_SCHHA